MGLRKAFTLVELIVVVCVIGILLTICIQRYVVVTGHSKMAAFEANHRTAAAAMSMYAADNNGQWPQTVASLSPYLQGAGLSGMDGDPEGSSYSLSGGVLISKFNGTTLTFEP